MLKTLSSLLQYSAVEQPIVCQTTDVRVFIGSVGSSCCKQLHTYNPHGLIFVRQLRETLEPHLKKVIDFWCSLFLENRLYARRALPENYLISLKGE